MSKIAIIIGAGPAGLTAALELVTKTDIKPIVFETTTDIGGISKTVNYNGNRIDIGGHRFFSKSDRVMNWWKDILPIEEDTLDSTADNADKKMLVRNRQSRIFYMSKFFDYPVTLSVKTLKNLGAVKVLKVGISYILTRIFPPKNLDNLENFYISRFGRELYNTFFKSYTTRLWGIEPKELSADWGAQRVKGVSISAVIFHAIKSIFKPKSDISQKGIETSLIEKFLYPKYGPGQLWEEVASRVKSRGGEVHTEQEVIGLELVDNKVRSVEILNRKTNEKTTVEGDYFFSTMPIKHLMERITPTPPHEVLRIAQNLSYRDFITVGVLLKKLKVENGMTKDNWIYIHEPGVLALRIQIFNNWSPYMVKDPNTAWVGLEYTCNESDNIWNMSNGEMLNFALDELIKLGLADKEDFMDGTVIKMPKTYPTYTGSYYEMGTLRKYVDAIPNLYLIGRNGMHRYNNQDHSMLTAIEAVNNIVENVHTKDNIWSVNTEQDYHEEKK